MRRCFGVALASLALASAAGAQAMPGQFTVTPRGGVLLFDDAASIETGGALGIDAEYHFTRFFSIGTNLTYAQASTRGEDFIGRLTYGTVATGDTSFFFELTQPISIVDASLNGNLRFPTGRLAPFLTGGVGVYTLFLDPQVTRGDTRIARMSANVGGGLALQLGERAGVTLDVRDLIFTDYNRERLRPAGGRFQNYQFPTEFPTAPAPKSTVHNFMISLGFMYAPRFGGSGRDVPDDTPEGGQ